jgi:hypothetical protein
MSPKQAPPKNPGSSCSTWRATTVNGTWSWRCRTSWPRTAGRRRRPADPSGAGRGPLRYDFSAPRAAARCLSSLLKIYADEHGESRVPDRFHVRPTRSSAAPA